MAKLGIDLGTSNSAAAAVFDMDKRNPVTIEPSEGSYQGNLAFPSYVAFNKKGEYSAAGLPASERFLQVGGSDLVVRYFKRLIGRNYDYVMGQIMHDNRAFSEFKGRIKPATDGSILITVGGRDISIEEVASHLLRKIMDDAQILLQNRGERIESVTISFPAGFEDSQRQATLRAARMAGIEGVDIQVIEEPTAAAIAKGLTQVEGSIMVVDVGAGTTDVIIGHMEPREEGLKLIMISRECDDVLGGIDMDNLILKYVFANDTGSPKLEDVFDGLATDMQLRLMGKIEEAKIIASRDGASSTSITVIVGAAAKRVNITMDEAKLSKIVAPIIDGYVTGNNYLKGVKPVIERALLKAAGGNRAAVPKVIEEIQWLILVGGPCRMKALHQMLSEVFTNNKLVMLQINNINPQDGFFKEGVARGAALSQVKGIEVSTAVPYTLSILHQSGKTPVIAAATPYNRVNGIGRSVMIPMHQGSNQIWILSEKENNPAREWTIDGHLVNVPQEGKLTVNIKWSERGTEQENMSVEGCGLPGAIAFPPRSNMTKLGTEMDNRYKWYFGVAKDLRKLVDFARDPVVRLFLPRVSTATEAERLATEWLRVSEDDLRQSENIDVEREYYLTDEELQTALTMDYFEMRKQVAIERGLLSPEATEVLDRALSIVAPQSSTSTDQLISEANILLNSSQNCSPCIQYWQQLTQWLHQLQLSRDDLSVASATATALGALADCLYKEKVITEEEFYHIQGVCWSFHRDL
ncbi:Hsp70 family protein [Chloroflexota bacterium]